jgi:hypothetical protein
MARVMKDPYTTNQVSIDGLGKLGQVYDGLDSLGLPAKFRLVQFKDAVTYVAGHVCEFADVSMTTVTNDKSGGSSLGRCPAGVALLAQTQNYYGYVLCQGYHASVLGAGSVGVGEAVMSHATTDGAADTQTAGNKQIGVALADDSGSPTTFAAYLNCL